MHGTHNVKISCLSKYSDSAPLKNSGGFHYPTGCIESDPYAAGADQDSVSCEASAMMADGIWTHYNEIDLNYSRQCTVVLCHKCNQHYKYRICNTFFFLANVMRQIFFTFKGLLRRTPNLEDSATGHFKTGFIFFCLESNAETVSRLNRVLLTQPSRF